MKKGNPGGFALQVNPRCLTSSVAVQLLAMSQINNYYPTFQPSNLPTAQLPGEKFKGVSLLLK
ncbi:hypothetical protein [Desulforamulus reducens]|uniref:hypothetical protein n=1 Tax=Desulforamulus reducens TaxID=59610 RepID=UPI00059D1372|nr:hypothetical protein [Desulforamulus reducens]